MAMSGLDSKNTKEFGTTLLEALVATAIVGIGFIVVFQMVNFAIRSIDVSGERTKISYLTDMVAEDLLAYRDSKKGSVKFHEALVADRNDTTDSSWSLSGCQEGSGITVNTSAEDNTFNKWENRFSQRRIKCRGSTDNKILNTYTICNSGCTDTNATIFDTILIGKMQVVTGDNTKNLFFRIK